MLNNKFIYYLCHPHNHPRNELSAARITGYLLYARYALRPNPVVPRTQKIVQKIVQEHWLGCVSHSQHLSPRYLGSPGELSHYITPYSLNCMCRVPARLKRILYFDKFQVYK